MNKNGSLIIGFVGAAVLAGCADDGSDYQAEAVESEYAELQAVYPTAYVKTGSLSATTVFGQQEGIPTTAAAVYRFDRSVKGLEPLDHIRFVWKREVTEGHATYDEDVPIDFHVEYRDGGRTLVVIPDEHLVPFREYEVYVPLKRDPEILPEYQDIAFGRYYSSHFTVAPAWQGTPEETSLNTDYFMNENMIPFVPFYTHDIRSQELPVLPFSSLTVEMTQPIDPATVSYGDGPGDNIRLVQRETRDPIDIDVDVQVSGRYLTLDPRSDLPVGEELSIDLAEEGDPDAIKSVTGMSLRQSASGGLTFGTTGDPGTDYEILPDWPTTMTVRPLVTASRFTNTATNSVVDANGHALKLAEQDMAVRMVSIPEEIGFSNRTFFSITRSDRSPGERRLALLSDAYGYIDWRTQDPYADDSAYDKAMLYADIGIIDENGDVEASGRGVFHGRASGDIRDGDFVVDLITSVDPAAFAQERLPGNGMINLKLRMTGASAP